MAETKKVRNDPQPKEVRESMQPIKNDYIENFKLPDNDSISVEEMKNLMEAVEKFYFERGDPKMNIVWLADLILKRLKLDRDYFINIEGVKGTGKSNFILLLSLIQTRYAGLYRDEKNGNIIKVLPRLKPMPERYTQLTCGFSFKNNMSFLDESEDVKRKFNGLDKYHPMIIDEGSKNLHKYQWNNKLQFLLVRMSDTERWQNKSVYVCFPNFKELNPAFRNDRILMRIYLYDRNIRERYASCILSLRDMNRYISDPWHNDENAKSYEYLLKRVPIALRTARHVLNTEKKLKNYAGDFDVPSLEAIAPRIWDIYMQYKSFYANRDSNNIASEDEESVKVIKLKTNLRRALDYIESNFPNLTKKDMQKILGLTSPAYVKLINETDKDTLDVLGRPKQ